MKVTAQQVFDAAVESGEQWVPHHACGICGVMTGFILDDESISFDSSCGCASSYPQPRTWQDAADWINMQSDPKHAAEIAKRFGLVLDEGAKP